MITLENIFTKLKRPEAGQEVVEKVVSTPNARIELIASGENDSPSQWYDQDEDEFVMVLGGYAELLFEEGNEIFKMRSGDCVDIPSHKRHRVNKTSQDTYWVAVFYRK